MQNISKAHEQKVQANNHVEQVDNILANVENTPFALRGATTKTILYFLFSVVAAAELTAALFFYTSSLGLSFAVALVICGLFAFGFHGLLHGILSDTAKGIVFSKRKESGAMSNEVTANIVLSIVLLLGASCTVFFVGKKGFTAYRATQYEQAQAKPKDDVKEVTVDMLTNSKGKVAAWKLEALTDLEKAKAKTTEAATAQATTERQAYDNVTANITDIVGASAFVLELLLALLAYAIATAKKAAVIEEIARRKGVSQPNTSNDMSSNDLPQPQKQIGFSFNRANNSGNQDRVIIKGFQRENKENDVVTTYRNNDMSSNDLPENMGVCPMCDELFEKKNYKHTYCSEGCRVQAWEQKTGKQFKKTAKI
ncbi:MAG: hypothetical protein JNL70_13035 [Saprospiraceae bacterium]|nr:hypothetical protein [Saprospiraceae bacterium]